MSEPSNQFVTVAGRKGTVRKLWTALDQLMAVTAAAQRRSRSDDLVDEIADGLATAGEYVTRVDVLPRPNRWWTSTGAAHQAARRLGIRVHVDVQHANAAIDGRAAVRVAAQAAPE